MISHDLVSLLLCTLHLSLWVSRGRGLRCLSQKHRFPLVRHLITLVQILLLFVSGRVDDHLGVSCTLLGSLDPLLLALVIEFARLHAVEDINLLVNKP